MKYRTIKAFKENADITKLVNACERLGYEYKFYKELKKYPALDIYAKNNTLFSSVIVDYFPTYENGVKSFTLAGWNTVTTRSRLNALGVGVTQKNWTPMQNGREISSCQWYTL